MLKKLFCFFMTVIAVFFLGCKEENIEPKTNASFQNLVSDPWDDPSLWASSNDGSSKIELKKAEGVKGDAVLVEYSLSGEHGWAQWKHSLSPEKFPSHSISFIIKAEGFSDLEIKFLDSDQSTFGRKVSLKSYKDWTQVTIYLNNTDYWWGGDDKFDKPLDFYFAVSGKGNGKIMIDEIGYASEGAKASFPIAGVLLDPDRELPGIGFRQRRDSELIPEDTGVLEWLKTIQDVSSPDKAGLPSMESNEFQTFNNALVAMAFILEGERERAERILDFYSSATDRNNRCLRLQNFFYKGQARGFYQYVLLNDEGDKLAYHNPGVSDRWMGDMAWLLIACKYYEKTFHSQRYGELSGLLLNLLNEWYTDDNASGGGYVRHGWREGDKRLHENGGHPEGNIDAYAAFLLCGEKDRAMKIRKWLDTALKGKSLPLDLYTWRVLAFGKESADVLNIPEYDLRYRKTLDINGRKVVGMFHGAEPEISNIWTDGTGHMAVAHILYGDRERGYFYSNQLDGMLFDRTINGNKLRALPYAANTKGGYDWVKFDRGFVSCAAWYIFAKNKFNPLMLEKVE